MSQTCCLAVVASFIFLHIPIGLKFLFGAMITIVFSYFIQDFDIFVRILTTIHY